MKDSLKKMIERLDQLDADVDELFRWAAGVDKTLTDLDRDSIDLLDNMKVIKELLESHQQILIICPKCSRTVSGKIGEIHECIKS